MNDTNDNKNFDDGEGDIEPTEIVKLKEEHEKIMIGIKRSKQ